MRLRDWCRILSSLNLFSVGKLKEKSPLSIASKEGYLLDVTAIVAVEANVTHYSHEQKHDNNHLINIHTSITIEFFTFRSSLKSRIA